MPKRQYFFKETTRSWKTECEFSRYTLDQVIVVILASFLKPIKQLYKFCKNADASRAKIWSISEANEPNIHQLRKQKAKNMQLYALIIYYILF